MNFACRIGLFFCLVWLGSGTVPARELAAWRVGDTAEETLITPVALEVAAPVATAARQAEAALKTPAIFRNNSSITNTMVVKVRAAFAEAHSNFMAGIQEPFRKTSFNAATNQSAELEYFITAFNFKNKKFPITTALAREWARGGTGLGTQTNLIEQLLQVMNRPVRPDTTPDGFELGAALRVVPVRSSKEALTLDKARQRGTLMPLTNVTTVTRLRGLFRRDFPPEDQLVARTLATYLHPNCELDTNLTWQARDQAASQIKAVTVHYAAGQVIVQRGQKIDAKIQSALTKLNELLPPSQLDQKNAPTPTGQLPEPAVPVPGLPSTHNLWLVAGLSATATALLLALWRFVVRRRAAARSSGLTGLTVQSNSSLPPELAPQLAQALKSVVVQELAAQRRELLQTQQAAAAEVVRLMQRLNDLHTPLQERIGAYESRIQELEKELSARTEENRELLKLKIDLLRQQLEAERATPRVNFN